MYVYMYVKLSDLDNRLRIFYTVTKGLIIKRRILHLVAFFLAKIVELASNYFIPSEILIILLTKVSVGFLDLTCVLYEGSLYIERRLRFIFDKLPQFFSV